MDGEGFEIFLDFAQRKAGRGGGFFDREAVVTNHVFEPVFQLGFGSCGASLDGGVRFGDIISGERSTVNRGASGQGKRNQYANYRAKSDEHC